MKEIFHLSEQIGSANRTHFFWFREAGDYEQSDEFAIS